MEKQTAGSADPADPEDSFLMRLKARLLPQIPDFYALLIEQCAITAAGTRQLTQYMLTNDPSIAAEVRKIEHDGDRSKTRNIETLHRSFATPMDREDIYDAIIAIDEILNYAKSSVREMEILGITPDTRMEEMAGLVDEGAHALLSAFQNLKLDPAAADRESERARKTERQIEKAYRGALKTLFDPEAQAERLAAMNAEAGDSAVLENHLLVIMTQMLKRREIYRHLSNAGDHVAHAAQVLRDIINKAT